MSARELLKVPPLRVERLTLSQGLAMAAGAPLGTTGVAVEPTAQVGGEAVGDADELLPAVGRRGGDGSRFGHFGPPGYLQDVLDRGSPQRCVADHVRA